MTVVSRSEQEVQDLPHNEMVITLLKALRGGRIIPHSLWTQLPMNVCHDPEDGLQRYFTVREAIEGDRYWMLMGDDSSNTFCEGAVECVDHWIKVYSEKVSNFA